MAPTKSKAQLKDEENKQKRKRASEEYEAQLGRLLGFIKDGQQWSGKGKAMDVEHETLEEVARDQLDKGVRLGGGGGGEVSVITYRGVRMARKMIRLGNIKREWREEAAQEGVIQSRVGEHRHIVRLVGTYWKKFPKAGWAADDLTQSELYILTYPVANCDLQMLLDDCEETMMPYRRSPLDLWEELSRLVDMGFHVSKSSAILRVEIQEYLQMILGCLTEAVEWMHSMKVQHRDIKPGNILVRPGQILLTDFGLSRDRLKCLDTTTERVIGHSQGYAAPEILAQLKHYPEETDVYSLGCVFLHILAVVHAPNVQAEPAAKYRTDVEFVQEDTARHMNREAAFKAYLRKSTPGERHHPFLSDHMVEKVLAPMFIDVNTEIPGSPRRPSAKTVNTLLRELGGDKQIYHGHCCQKIAENNQTIFPTEKKWYRIINGKSGKALRTSGLISLPSYVEICTPAREDGQLWQFKAQRPMFTGKENPPPQQHYFYWISNKFSPNTPLSVDLGGKLILQTYEGFQRNKRQESGDWYFRSQRGPNGSYMMSSKRVDSKNHLGLGKRFAYELGKKEERGSYILPVMKQGDGDDLFWNLEEVDEPYLETDYPSL